MSGEAQVLRAMAESLLIPFLSGGEDPCTPFARVLDDVARRAEEVGVKGLRHLASLVVRWIERQPAPIVGARREALEAWVQDVAGFLVEAADDSQVARLLMDLPDWPGMPDIPPQFLGLIADRLRADARLIGATLGAAEPCGAEGSIQASRPPTDALEGTVRVARDELDILRESVDGLRADLAGAAGRGDGDGDARRLLVREGLVRVARAADFVGLEVLALLADRVAEESCPEQGLRLCLPALQEVLESLSRWLGDPRRHAGKLLRCWTEAPREQALAPHGRAGTDEVARVLPGPQALLQIGEALAAVDLVASRQTTSQSLVADTAALSLRIPPDADSSVVDQLLQELPERVGDFAEAIACLPLEDDTGRHEALHRAQRLAHTIKGSANTVGIRGVATITHQLEDLLHLLGRETGPLPEGVLETLLAAADCLGEMSDFLVGAGAEPRAAQGLSDTLSGWIHLQQEAGSAPFGEQAAADPVAVPPAPADPTPLASASPEALDWVRVPAQLLDQLLDLAGQAAIQLSQAREQSSALLRSREAARTGADRLQGLAAEAERLQLGRRGWEASPVGVSSSAFDALEKDAFDEFQMLSAGLSEAGSDSRIVEFQLDRQISGMQEHLEELERIQTEVREAVLQARTLPLATLVPRLQRAVRQAARMSGREVELEVLGQDTCIDGHLLQQLADPLMHLLRNAVDHGIESPRERVAAGKPGAGRIRLQVARLGSQLRLECSDDGRGLDFAAIRQRALAQGLVSTDSPLSEPELARLVLLPGFSTRTHATQLSGRGMGLDVAAGVVRQLRGRLGIDAGPGQGARFSLEIPERLSTASVAVATLGPVRVGLSVQGVERIMAAEGIVHDASGQALLPVGRDVVRVRRLDELLALSAPAGNPEGREPGDVALLVRQIDGECVAVFVSALSQTRSLVVRPLPSWLTPPVWQDGATVLGDGSVVAVVDLPRLLAYAVPGPRRRRQRLPPALPRCLIADDSPSVRRAMEMFLRDLGFEVESCVDGVQALAAARSHPPAVAILDLEMPRLDGLELAAALRADPRTAPVPLIMITSRFSEAHRARALASGVDVFLSKPYDEDELASRLRDCLERGRPLG